MLNRSKACPAEEWGKAASPARSPKPHHCARLRVCLQPGAWQGNCGGGCNVLLGFATDPRKLSSARE